MDIDTSLPWGFLLHNKSSAKTKLRNFCIFIETQFQTKIQMVRSDNGMEFSMPDFFDAKGIIHQMSCVYTLQQDGVVERKHQHLLNIGSALKIQSSLPLSYWGYCIKHAATLINLTPTPLLSNKAPFEILYSKLPSYSFLEFLVA